ncbi:hypothetical protein COO60DRAFT_785713 [Scenedesmus sp. NREL 46B-D3]|nr:hypothetical protein COO60DRAFT_785713 [Scenedesmus sp. NREL 46B-D3]
MHREELLFAVPFTVITPLIESSSALTPVRVQLRVLRSTVHNHHHNHHHHHHHSSTVMMHHTAEYKACVSGQMRCRSSSAFCLLPACKRSSICVESTLSCLCSHAYTHIRQACNFYHEEPTSTMHRQTAIGALLNHPRGPQLCWPLNTSALSATYGPENSPRTHGHIFLIQFFQSTFHQYIRMCTCPRLHAAAAADASCLLRSAVQHMGV